MWRLLSTVALLVGCSGSTGGESYEPDPEGAAGAELEPVADGSGSITAGSAGSSAAGGGVGAGGSSGAVAGALSEGGAVGGAGGSATAGGPAATAGTGPSFGGTSSGGVAGSGTDTGGASGSDSMAGGDGVGAGSSWWSGYGGSPSCPMATYKQVCADCAYGLNCNGEYVAFTPAHPTGEAVGPSKPEAEMTQCCGD
jgi:hypothetical protein